MMALTITIADRISAGVWDAAKVLFAAFESLGTFVRLLNN